MNAKLKNQITDGLSFRVISASPQSGKWPLIPSAQAPRDDVARLPRCSCLPTKGGVSRAIIFCLSLFSAIVSVFAESYPNRPTASEMDEYVEQGIICGKAVRERELAVNRSQSFLPYCGVWQPYIVSLQQELETLASIYIDHENGPLTDAGDEFLYFTLDNWRAAAGLNVSGFRRSTDGASFSCGQMQTGDIIGPWIFEDLQKGFGALKWVSFFLHIVSVKSIFPTVTGQASYYGSGSGENFGVWYTYNGTRLGGSGAYSIVLDTRQIYGVANAFYISVGGSSAGMGFSGHGGAFYLDTGYGEGVLPYSASLTFLDSTSLVQVYGCRLIWTDAESYSISFSASSASASAELDAGHESVAAVEFYPVIKVPFTNTGY